MATSDEQGRVVFGAELYGPEASARPRGHHTAGFTDIEIRPTQRVHTHAQGAIIRASH